MHYNCALFLSSLLLSLSGRQTPHGATYIIEFTFTFNKNIFKLLWISKIRSTSKSEATLDKYGKFHWLAHQRPLQIQYLYRTAKVK